MAIKLYNQRTKAFVSFVASDSADLPFTELLLLNILIELQAQTEILLATNKNQLLTDTPQQIRYDAVNEV